MFAILSFPPARFIFVIQTKAPGASVQPWKLRICLHLLLNGNEARITAKVPLPACGYGAAGDYRL
jgi:hypothetical protein